MIRLTSSGDFSNLEKFLKSASNRDYRRVLDTYGKRGVDALSSATPFDTGRTANKWDYEIHETREGFELVWTNSNVNEGANVAILIQYGHGTGTGGYVRGYDYINPALRPVFDGIADDIVKAVNR
jgi:hypothetical protein